MITIADNLDAHHPAHRPWVYRAAVAQVLLTFALIVLGGTVTSKGAGLAVPDWPTTFGYNMFGVPLVLWVGRGGVFWEHSHRLLGSFVGLVSIIMLMLLWTPWLTQRVPYRFEGLRLRRFDPSTMVDRPWLRKLALAALALVIWQGVMGGLRVTQIDYRWGIVHGMVAQFYLCVTVLVAAATSRWWLAAPGPTRLAPREKVGRLRVVCVVLLGVLLVQLGLGAATRHMEAGLAIYDFPASYGRIVPPLSQSGIDDALNALPYDHHVFTAMRGAAPFTAAQVGVHFAHRVWALAVVAIVLFAATRFVRAFGLERRITRPTLLLVALLVLQIALGVSVIWTGRHEHTATTHQATGAIVLAVAALLTFRIYRLTHGLTQSAAAKHPIAHAPRKMHLQGAGA